MDKIKFAANILIVLSGSHDTSKMNDCILVRFSCFDITANIAHQNANDSMITCVSKGKNKGKSYA